MLKFLKIFVPASAGAATMLTTAYFLADQFVVDIPAPLRPVLVQAAQADDTATQTPAQTGTQTAAAVGTAALQAPEGGFGLGRVALADEIAAWDIDVRPDGMGLPEGSGDVWTGEEVFVAKCAMCHGDFGEAVGRWPVLAGGQGTLEREDPVKTIGSYWPYLSTVFDYVYRAMPFGEAQSLTPDEVYAITAYLLYVNDLVEDDFELNHENFADVRLPNEDNFYMDDRAETELPVFTTTPCMTACKDSAEITMHASVLDVTPDEGGQDAEDTGGAAAQTEAPAQDVTQDATMGAEAEDSAPAQVVAQDAGVDPELVAAGEGAFRQCRACHQVGENARNATGPHLGDMIGRTVGGIEGFRYSNVFQDASAAGEVWTVETLSAFLADPRGARPGTRMSFNGVRKDEDIAALIAYLGSLGAP